MTSSLGAAQQAWAGRDGPRIRQVLGSPGAYTTELLRLLLVYPHRGSELEVLGVPPEDMAAHVVGRLPEQGGTLFVADDGGRLQGFVALTPDLWPSAHLGHHVWTLSHLVPDPGLGAGGVAQLVSTALSSVEGPLDMVAARVPAADAVSIRALKETGFRVVGGEVVGAIQDLDVPPPDLAGVRFLPMESRHREAARRLTRTCQACNPYACDDTFGADQVATLIERRVTQCLNDGLCETWVAEDDTRALLGLVSTSLEPSLEASLGRRIATLDFIGVDPGHRGQGLATSLLAHALGRLGSAGVSAMRASTVMAGAGPLSELAALHQVGYQIANTRLIMHRWTGRGIS